MLELTLTSTARVPMTIAEVDALVAAGVCPCQRGILGACSRFPEVCNTGRKLGQLWTLVWLALNQGAYQLSVA